MNDLNECGRTGLFYPWRDADAQVLNEAAVTRRGKSSFWQVSMTCRCERHAPAVPPANCFRAQAGPCDWVTPRRIQRKRTPGWRLPLGAQIVTRPTMWGNPFKVDEPWCPDAQTAVALYRTWLELGGLPVSIDLTAIRLPSGITTMNQWRNLVLADAPLALSGRVLACFCPENAPYCHCDYLLALANRHILGAAA